MRCSELAIVGAGPAGMSAAIAAAETGLRPVVIDENPAVGGQIYRQPPKTFEITKADRRNSVLQQGEDLRRRFQSLTPSIELLTDTTVWGFFPAKRLAVARGDTWQMIEAEALVLAPGAYEYVPPFPGWTLPGVMTPGAAQLLVKSMGVRPGHRVLLAGTGPFLLVVACALDKAGANVVGIVEAATTLDGLRALPSLLWQPQLLRQGWRYLRQIRRAGIPQYRGHVVVAAHGVERVRSVTFAPCDSEWFPDRSCAREVEVDTLCVGYGFVPRTQLAQLAGCRMRFADELGGWIPDVGEHLETSVAGIWVAGDGGGVAGAVVAELEGRLAGLAAAHRLGALDETDFMRLRRPILRRLRRLTRFRAALDRVSRPRPGLSSLATDDTLVCRCEELTRAEVEVGIAAGGTDIRTLKVMTRLGMGPCQGRMCWPAMARYIAQRTGKTYEDIGPLSVRPPIKPATLGTLAAPEEAGRIAGKPRVEVTT